MDTKELYQEIILDHGKNPRNLKKCENFNKDAKGYNPLCGDKVHVYLNLNNGNKVQDISFEGSGCAISMASASIMTDLVKGKNVKVVKEIIEDFLSLIKENSELKSDKFIEDEKIYNWYFKKNLLNNIDVPLCLWDERLSTVGAFNLSSQLDVNVSKKVKNIDKNAAAFILQGAIDYLKN